MVAPVPRIAAAIKAIKKDTTAAVSSGYTVQRYAAGGHAIADAIKTECDILQLTREFNEFMLLLAQLTQNLINASAGSQRDAELIDLLDNVRNKDIDKFFKINIPPSIENILSKYFDPKVKYIGIAPGAGDQDRVWPLQNFIDVAKHFEKLNFKIVWFIGPNEIKIQSSFGKFLQVMYSKIERIHLI